MASKKVVFDDGAIKVYDTGAGEKLLQTFTDTISKRSAKKEGRIRGKGVHNNTVSAHLFEYLSSHHILNHFISKDGDRDSTIVRTDPVHLEVLITNRVTGTLPKRFGLKEGEKLDVPVLEYYYMNDRLKHPFINDSHAMALNIASKDELLVINRDSLKVNAILTSYFERRNLDLAQYVLHFGRQDHKIVVTDALIPEMWAIWDMESGKKLNVFADYNHLSEHILGADL